MLELSHFREKSWHDDDRRTTEYQIAVQVSHRCAVADQVMTQAVNPAGLVEHHLAQRRRQIWDFFYGDVRGDLQELRAVSPDSPEYAQRLAAIIKSLEFPSA